MSRIGFLLAILLFSLPGTAFLGGCASSTTRTTTETVDRPADEKGIVERETTVTEDESSRPGGIISGTLDLIGFIIALPFKVVAGVVELIF